MPFCRMIVPLATVFPLGVVPLRKPPMPICSRWRSLMAWSSPLSTPESREHISCRFRKARHAGKSVCRNVRRTLSRDTSVPSLRPAGIKLKNPVGIQSHPIPTGLWIKARGWPEARGPTFNAFRNWRMIKPWIFILKGLQTVARSDENPIPKGIGPTLGREPRSIHNSNGVVSRWVVEAGPFGCRIEPSVFRADPDV